MGTSHPVWPSAKSFLKWKRLRQACSRAQQMVWGNTRSALRLVGLTWLSDLTTNSAISQPKTASWSSLFCARKGSHFILKICDFPLPCKYWPHMVMPRILILPLTSPNSPEGHIAFFFLNLLLHLWGGDQVLSLRSCGEVWIGHR